MRGLILNLAFVVIVIAFVFSVEWSAWVSVPIGALMGVLLLCVLGYVEGRVGRRFL